MKKIKKIPKIKTFSVSQNLSCQEHGVLNPDFKIKIISLGIILLFLISIISAQGTYQIKDNQVIFSLASSEGIYNKGQILQGTQKIADIQLCDTDRCLKTITPSFNLTTEMLGTYQLAYYSYNTYKWEMLDFTIASNSQFQSNNQNPGSDNENPAPTTQNSANNSPKNAGLIKFICRIHTLLTGKYQECLNEYL